MDATVRLPADGTAHGVGHAHDETTPGLPVENNREIKYNFSVISTFLAITES